MYRLPDVYTIVPHGKTILPCWLDGNVICKESARYIHINLSVYSVRPRDPNDDPRSDEDFSDEEFVLIEAALEQALKTRVGGSVTDNKHGKVKPDTSKASHEETFPSGIQLASHIWLVGDDSRAQENQMPDTNDDDFDASLAAVRASQRKEKSGQLSVPQEDEHGCIIADSDRSVLDIRNWLEEIRARQGPDKKQNE